jgi:hypothetical protein
MRGRYFVARSNIPRLAEIVAGVQEAIDPQTIHGPLLDLVEVAGRRGVGRRFLRGTSRCWSSQSNNY